MTFPSVVKLLLIFAPSFSLVPLAPVDSALSEPARSTRDTLLTFKLSKLLPSLEALNMTKAGLTIMYLLCRESTVLIMNVLGEDDGEDGVGPAGGLVHVGGGHRPGLVPLLHQIINIVVACHRYFAEILNIWSQQWMFTDSEISFATGIQ